MASLLGVSSIYQAPSFDLSRKPSSTTPSISLLFSEKTRSRAAALGGGRTFFGKSYTPHRTLLAVVPSAIAAPSSILSEKAFKGLDGFSDDSLGRLGDDEEDDEIGGGFVEGASRGKDELAITKLGLPAQLVESLQRRGITELFPIQRAVLVPALEGRDLIARAKTGTGKTLAFGIPILKRLTEDEDRSLQRRSGRLPRLLVLAPTRELAKQVEKEIKESAPYLNTVCVYGGVSYSLQQNALSRGVDVAVGTPGRITDLVNSNSLKLSEVQYLVLDEADQMLAVGFEEDVEHILQQLPAKRQSMLFSATMPTWVKKLSRKYLDNPLTIDLVGDSDEKLAEGIKLYAILATSTSKRIILSDLIMVYAKGGKTIVFTQTKRDADEVSLALTSSITSEALHGDISQHQRERTLNGFRQGKFTVLVATDVAARGLDIPNVDLVIHYEMPNDPETFVHRSGRTGRAGKEGTAILMFTSSQRRTVRSLEHDVGCSFEFVNAPATQDVLEASAEQVVATLNGVHPDSVQFFTPTAQRLFEEHGTNALAAALAQMSGFSQPPSARSLLSHEQGWVTLQLTRDPLHSRGFLSANGVMGLLSDVYRTAADEVGKICLIADEKVQGAVFDLPEETAKELLNKQTPPGNTISRITKLPALQDDGPPSDNYGRFSNRERSSRGGSRARRGGFNSSRGWGSSQDSDFDDLFKGGGRSYGSDTESGWPRKSRGGGTDWLIGGRGTSRSSSGRSYGGNRSYGGERSYGGNRSYGGERSYGGNKSYGGNRSFGGSCFNCGESGHRASECPSKQSGY